MSDANPKFQRKPNHEIYFSMSKDGKFLIVKRVESWILPRKYADVVLASANPKAASDSVPAADRDVEIQGS